MAVGEFKKGNLQKGIYIFGSGHYYHGKFANGSPNDEGVYSNIKY
jgi:hypothetical protein